EQFANLPTAAELDVQEAGVRAQLGQLQPGLDRSPIEKRLSQIVQNRQDLENVRAIIGALEQSGTMRRRAFGLESQTGAEQLRLGTAGAAAKLEQEQRRLQEEAEATYGGGPGAPYETPKAAAFGAA